MRQWEAADVLMDRAGAAARIAGLAMPGRSGSVAWEPPLLPLSEDGCHEAVARLDAELVRRGALGLSRRTGCSERRLTMAGGGAFRSTIETSDNYAADGVGVPATIEFGDDRSLHTYRWSLVFRGGEIWGAAGTQVLVLDQQGGMPPDAAGDMMKRLWAAALPPLLLPRLLLPGSVAEAVHWDGSEESEASMRQHGLLVGRGRNQVPRLAGSPLVLGWWAVRLADTPWNAFFPMPPEAFRVLMERQFGRGLPGGIS